MKIYKINHPKAKFHQKAAAWQHIEKLKELLNIERLKKFGKKC